MKLKPLIRWTSLAIASAALLALAFAVSRSRAVISGGDDIPVGEAKRGDLRMTVHGTGELSASHTAMLTAPAVGGGALQITRLSDGRLPVKKGDVVLEFDPSEQRYKLEQSRSELLQAEQEIAKAKADAAVLAAQDKVALLKARFDVRQAELDVQKKEIVSAIDGAKNDAALQQAKRLLDELEKDVESHTASGQASIYLSQEKYIKAKLEMNQAQQNIDRMRVTAPMDGLISIQKNMDASGGFFFTGMSLPDYRAGDQAQSGSAIAQVVDPAGLELTAKIGERERSNIKAGEAVQVVFDALPGKQFQGTVGSVGGMATRQFFDDNNAGGTFSVSIQLANLDPRLRSGMTAQLLFLGDTSKDVTYVPRQAIFLKDGKRVVYVRRGSGYEQREVSLRGETESRAIVTATGPGLAAGTSLALIDPTIPRKPDASNASSIPAGGAP
jgi:multidrug resistance efflux pump